MPKNLSNEEFDALFGGAGVSPTLPPPITDTQRYFGVTGGKTYFPIEGEQNYEDVYGPPEGWDYKTAKLGWNNEPLPNGALSWDRYGEPYWGEGLGAWVKKLAANINDPYIEDIQEPTYVEDPDEFAEHFSNVMAWAGYQVGKLRNIGASEEVEIDPETGEEVVVEKPTLLTKASRTLGSAIQGVLDAFGLPAVAVERGLGGYSIGISEVAKYSDLPEMPSLFGKATDTGKPGFAGMIANGLEILDRTVNPIRMIWDTVRAIDAPLTAAQKKEKFDLGFAAGRMAYSAVYDMTLREEFMRKVASGEDPGLVSRELQNPIAEAWGQIVADPLNIVGYFLTKFRKMGAVIRSAEELASATPEIKNAYKVVTAASKVDDARKYDEALIELGKAVMASTDQVRQGISRTADAKGVGMLFVNTTESARKLRLSQAGGFLSWLAGNTQDESQLYTMMKGLMQLASEHEDEVLLGVDLVSGFMKPDLMMSRQALETGVLLRRMFVEAGETLNLDKTSKFMKGLQKALSADDELTKVEKLLEFANGKLTKAAEGMFPTVAERIARGDDIDFVTRIASKAHNRMQKFYRPVNGFFANIYMGLSPGYAARNWMSNNIHIFADNGFGAYFEKAGQWIHKGMTTPKYITIEHAENGIRKLLGYLPPAVHGFGGPAGEFIEEGAKWWKQPFMKLSEGLERKAAVRAVYKNVRDVMSHMLQEGRALPSLDAARELGMTDDMAGVLIDLVMKHSGNVDDAMREWHTLAGSGKINLGKTLLWADTEDIRKLDDILPGMDIPGQIREILDDAEDWEDAVTRINDIKNELLEKADLHKFEETRIAAEGGGLAHETSVIGQELARKGVLTPDFVKLKDKQFRFNENVIEEFRRLMMEDYPLIRQKLIEAGATSKDIEALDAIRNSEKYAPYFEMKEYGKIRTEWAQNNTKAWAATDRWRQMIKDGVKDSKAWAQEWINFFGAEGGTPPRNLTGEKLLNWMWDSWFFRRRSMAWSGYRDTFGGMAAQFYGELDQFVSKLGLEIEPLWEAPLARAMENMEKARVYDNARFLRNGGMYPFTPGMNVEKDAIRAIADAYNISTQSVNGAKNPQLRHTINKALREIAESGGGSVRKTAIPDLNTFLTRLENFSDNIIRNPLGAQGGMAYVDGDKVARLDFTFQGGKIRLSAVEVPEELRGQGLATKALQELKNFADDAGIEITGSAKAFGQGDMLDDAQLVEFYKKMGWEVTQGKDMVLRGSGQTGEIAPGLKWAEEFVNTKSGLAYQFEKLTEAEGITPEIVEGALQWNARQKGNEVLDLKYIWTRIEEERELAKIADANYPSPERLDELFLRPHEQRYKGGVAPDPDFVALQREAGIKDELIIESMLPTDMTQEFDAVFGVEAIDEDVPIPAVAQKWFDPDNLAQAIRNDIMGDEGPLTAWDDELGAIIDVDTGQPLTPDELEKHFGEFTFDDDYTGHVDPGDMPDAPAYLSGENLNTEYYLAALEETNPVTAGIVRWALGGDGKKDVLLEAIRDNPELAQAVQDFTQLALKKHGITEIKAYNGKVTLWRGVKEGRERVRPWESMTTSLTTARGFSRKRGNMVVEWEIPVENLFATYQTHPGLRIFGENEVLLNARGTYGATLKSVNGIPATPEDVLKYTLHLPADDPARVAGRLPLPNVPTEGSAPSWAEALYHNFHSGEEKLDDYNKLFDRIVSGVRENWDKTLDTTGSENLDDVLAEWANGAKGGVAEARLHAQEAGRIGRNFTLHDYNDRKNLDLLLAYIYPYHFWYGRTYKNWIRRTVDPVQGSPGLIAAYSKYRTLMERQHAGAPDFWKYNINSDELFGIFPENPLFFNLESTLNPLHGLTGVDFTDPYRRSTWYSAMLEDVNRFGPTTFTPFNYAVAAALMMEGENEAASRFGTRLFPQTLAVKSLYSLSDKYLGFDPNEVPLLGLLDNDPATSFFNGGYDAYERNRIGRAIGWLVQENPTHEAEILESAQQQSGEWWDAAVSRATQARAPGQLMSFLFGVGFKARSKNDLEIDRFYNDLHRLYENRENLRPDEFSAQFGQLREKYPFMDGVLLARKHGIEADVAYAFNVLSRIPPGGQGEIMGALGIEQELVNKFYDDKADMENWPESDQMRFMAAIVDIGAILDLPELATREEWQQARDRYSMMADTSLTLFGEGIEALADGYFALLDGTDAGKQASYKYLEMFPQVKAYLDWKEQTVTNDPLLNAYYGGIESINYYYRGLMYTQAEAEFGKNIFDIQSTYYAFRDAGEYREASAYKKKHPELEAYWDFKREKEQEIAQRLIALSLRLPTGTDPRLRDTRGRELSFGAQTVQQTAEQGVVPSQQPPPEYFMTALGANTYALVMDSIFSGEPIADEVRGDVEQVAMQMGMSLEMLLELMRQSVVSVPQ